MSRRGISAANAGVEEKRRENDIAESVARWTKVTGIGTLVAAVFAAIAAYIFWSQLREMQTQIDEQRGEFRIDQRPFVGIDETEIRINKPLTFDQNTASLDIDMWFRNTGKSVAVSTASMERKFTIGPYPMPDQGQLFNIINCHVSIAADFTRVGTIILPGARSKFNLKETVPREGFQSDPDGGLVSAWLPLCIVYRDIAGNPHGTGFILFFETSEGEVRFAPTGQPKGEFKIMSTGASIF
jgi:hypothetical protein